MEKGDIIGGRYRLDRKIGQGATGIIWLAADERLSRRVAIKFLYAPNAAHQARLAKRVALEAKIAASIQHRNVIQIFDFGTHDKNIPYIVMEALTGFTLGEAFDATHTFSLDTLIHIMSEVLRGLSAVHDAGIVHRDLKPENIFLVKEARGKLSPKLLDFGISRSLEPEMPSPVTTTEGLIVGTPQYMSPEQARGDREIDRRTDIYSFGTIMFEAFAGVVPFPVNTTAAALIAVLQHEPPSLYDLAPQIGRALCAVVDRALVKVRDERYADAAEMLDALTAAGLEVPPELDRQAPMFPPAAIRSRARPRPDESEAPSAPADTVDTTQDAEVPRTGTPTRNGRLHPSGEGTPLPATVRIAGAVAATPRPQLVVPRTLWLALGAVVLISLALVAGVTILDRVREAGGSGFIVVQASPNPAAPEPPPAAKAPAPEPPTPPPNAPQAEPAAQREKRPNAKSRKAAVPADPMQLMASRVSDAFSKQKASVIACLNKHAGDIEGAPQLNVRLRLDRTGVAREAELLPASISNKPVAACLKEAVRKMSFPQPEQAATFSVPLLWRRK